MKSASQSDWQADAFIRAALAPFDAPPTDLQCIQIRTYVNLLLKWNEKVNLTAITSPPEILTRHFGESAFALRRISVGPLLDIGSGAGFPGLVLKLFNPALEITLAEPVLKKAAFIKEAARCLGVIAEVRTERFEDMDVSESSLETITVRAVRIDGSLLESAVSWLRPRGKILAWLAEADSANLARWKGFEWSAVPIPYSRSRVLIVGEKL